MSSRTIAELQPLANLSNNALFETQIPGDEIGYYVTLTQILNQIQIQNLANDNQIAVSNVDGTLSFRNLVAGENITLTQTENSISIASTGGGGGEVNYPLNIPEQDLGSASSYPNGIPLDWSANNRQAKKILLDQDATLVFSNPITGFYGVADIIITQDDQGARNFTLPDDVIDVTFSAGFSHAAESTSHLLLKYAFGTYYAFAQGGGSSGGIISINQNANPNQIIQGTAGLLTVLSQNGTTTINIGDNVVTTTNVQTLSSKTLVTPTIASFVNANHNHENEEGGGQLGVDALSATGTKDDTTFLRGDNMWAVPAGGGNVSGPTTPVTDNAMVLFDETSGTKIKQNANVIVTDSIFSMGQNTMNLGPVDNLFSIAVVPSKTVITSTHPLVEVLIGTTDVFDFHTDYVRAYVPFRNTSFGANNTVTDAFSYNAGVKQSFSPNAEHAGINVGFLNGTSLPTDPARGDIVQNQNGMFYL